RRGDQETTLFYPTTFISQGTPLAHVYDPLRSAGSNGDASERSPQPGPTGCRLRSWNPSCPTDEIWEIALCASSSLHGRCIEKVCRSSRSSLSHTTNSSLLRLRAWKPDYRTDGSIYLRQAAPTARPARTGQVSRSRPTAA